MKLVKCFWCGQDVPITHKGNAKPHMNGAQQCPGGGYPAAAHERWRELREASRDWLYDGKKESTP